MRALYVALLCCVLAEADAVAKSNPDYQRLLQQGRIEYRNARFAASEKLLIAALKTLQRSDEAERAAALAELGDVYLNQEKIAEAESAYSEALTIFRRLPDVNKTIVAMRNLGAIYSLERRDSEAMRILQQGLKLIKTNPGAQAALASPLLNSLGIAYFRQGNIGKAEASFNRALEIELSSGRVSESGALLINLGMLYRAKHNFEKAEDLLKQALESAESIAGRNHPDTTFPLSALANLYSEEGRYAEAERLFLRSLTILEPNRSDLDPRIARTLHAMSAMYKKAGRQVEGDNALARAAMIALGNVGRNSDLAAILDEYSAALQKQGKKVEAEEFRSEARRARAASGLVIFAHGPY